MSGVLNRRLRPLLLVAVPGAAVLAALLFCLWSGRYVTTENAYVKAHIAQISAEVAGRIHEVHVHDHAEVTAGDVLFTLDQEPFRVALTKAEAELDSISSQVRSSQRSSRSRSAGSTRRSDCLKPEPTCEPTWKTTPSASIARAVSTVASIVMRDFL